MNWQDMGIDILGPAFLAGLLVLSTHVPLGQRVLERGIIFIDLAIAQLAGLGVLAAHAFGLDEAGIWVQFAAFSSALLGALLFYWTERLWPDIQEALIGCAFVLGATAAILLLARDPLAGEHLKELLVGQILWVDYQTLAGPGLLSMLILIGWFGFRAHRSHLLFYGLFAVAVTTAVQLVGVYLVFASLILPALAGRFLPSKQRLVAGYGVGLLGYAGGLVLSAWFDLPAGPLIVWTLALAAVAVLVPVRLAGLMRQSPVTSP